ncbi:MAG: TCP-1/cpn60 chaperonin family protein, partial [Candidatus Bathyarchaeia archaeon]
IVTSAFLKVAAAGGSQVDLDCIDIKKKEGASLGESLMIEGLAYPHEIGHPSMPTRVENARIAVLKGEFKVTRTGEERKHGFLIEDTNQLRAAKEEEDHALRAIVEKLVKVGANVVFVEKGIHPSVLDRLGTHGILGIRRMVIEDLERIAKAAGGRVATRISDLTATDLGAAGVVEERKISGQPWIFVEGCKNAKAVAILLRGVNKHLLSEAEAVVNNGLRALKSLKMKPAVVPGGGAAEMEAAVRLRQWSSTVRGPRHFVLRSLADALETVPATLAQTSGLDVVESLTELRSLHSRGRAEAGINCLSYQAECSVEAAAYDPLIVKEQVVTSAFELASFVLRVDDFIQARKLEGGEFDYAQRQKGTAPERVKRIKQEYGIET